MRAIKILSSIAGGVLLYAFIRDGVPRLFVARMQHIYRLETMTKAPNSEE